MIVVDKLLTGFDEPKVAVMYLDRHLTGHTLLQAVARVNRNCDGKDYGYIIDYYPVKMEMMDFFIVFATIFLISLLASLLPTLRLNLKSQNHES